MSLVKGDNVLVAKYLPLIDEWVLLGCARSCSLSLSTTMIPVSVTGAAGWRKVKPAQHSFTGSMEGLVNLEDENILSLAELRASQIAREELMLRFQRTSVDGAVYTDEAYFYITNTSDEGAMNQMNSFTVDFEGSGALTQVFTPSEILSNVHRFQYTAVGGETVVTTVKDMNGNNLSLIGKTLLGYWKDGTGFSKLITSGTPTDKEVKFDSTTGGITVQMDYMPGEEVFGFYRN